MKGIVLSTSNVISTLIQEMLKEFYEISCVGNFDDFLNLLQNNIIDFVILDRTLDNITAKDVFAKLLQNNIQDLPPTILITQDKYDFNKDGIGYSFILRKPFNKEQINTVIESLLQYQLNKVDTVLIVDDSKTSRSILRKILIQNGYKCLEADNAKDGWKIVEIEKPDIIIVDYVMHGINGVEFARGVSKINNAKSAPIILISSSHDMQEIMDEGFDSGISAYFNKPYNENEIINFFNKYVASKIGCRILVIDDSSVKRKVIFSSLNLTGNFVVTVESISQAIMYIEDNDFDLILCDLILKDEDAIDAVKHIRNIEKDIPIIVYSSIADRKNVYNVLESGASDFLWSPIEMRELILKTKIWSHYSKLLNFEKQTMLLNKKLIKPENFMEQAEFLLQMDKLKNISSSLITIKNINESDIADIKKILRKDNILSYSEGICYLYLSNISLENTIRVCYRLKQSLSKNKNVTFGFSTINEATHIEELLKKSSENLLNL